MNFGTVECLHVEQLAMSSFLFDIMLIFYFINWQSNKIILSNLSVKLGKNYYFSHLIKTLIYINYFYSLFGIFFKIERILKNVINFINFFCYTSLFLLNHWFSYVKCPWLILENLYYKTYIIKTQNQFFYCFSFVFPIKSSYLFWRYEFHSNGINIYKKKISFFC